MKLILQLTALSGFFTVALGAFGAHALKSRLLELGTLDVFEKAVKYQIFHTLVLFAVCWLMSQYSHLNYSLVAYAFLLGILLFSGSLYILSISGIKAFGAITPLGGLSFLFGWIWLFIQISKIPSNG